MEAQQHAFYGLGIIAFVAANADGEIQMSERKDLQKLIKKWSSEVEANFDIAEIIFSIIIKNKHYEEISYENGMKYIRLGSNYLDESLKEKFLFLIQDIVHSATPVTEEEKALVKRFKADLHQL